MSDIIRFGLTDRKVEPPFEYVLLTNKKSRFGSYLDYYLYGQDELEEAIYQLKVEVARGHSHARIYKKDFINHDRTWRLQELFGISYSTNKLVYFEYGETQLHIVFYMNAGEWLNPDKEF